MIGNSLTSSNHGHVAKYLEKLSKAAGYKVTISYLAYGGECLETYADASSRKFFRAHHIK